MISSYFNFNLLSKLMSEQTNFILVLSICSDQNEAKTICHSLVSEHLIACANIIAIGESIYRWDGKICEEKEYLIIMKTQKIRLEKLIKRITAQHSYKVPEILAIPILGGLESYLDWIKEETN